MRLPQATTDIPRRPRVLRFLMGSPPGEKVSPFIHKRSEEPQHEVVIARPFAVSKYTVTADEFRACLADGACRTWSRLVHPAGNPAPLAVSAPQDFLRMRRTTKLLNIAAMCCTELLPAARSRNATLPFDGEYDGLPHSSAAIRKRMSRAEARNGRSSRA
jgi:hypothetical protein